MHILNQLQQDTSNYQLSKNHDNEPDIMILEDDSMPNSKNVSRIAPRLNEKSANIQPLKKVDIITIEDSNKTKPAYSFDQNSVFFFFLYSYNTKSSLS